MKEQNNLLRVDRKLTPEVKKSLKILSLIEELYGIALQKMSTSDDCSLAGLSEVLASLSRKEHNFGVAGFILHALKNTVDREIPHNAAISLKESYLRLDQFMVQAVELELAKIPALQETVIWSRGGKGEETVGRTIERIFSSGSSRDDNFKLQIADSDLTDHMAVDPRFVAIVIELSRNLFKRKDYAESGLIKIKKDDESHVNVAMQTQGLADHGCAIFNRITLPTEHHFCGVGFLVNLARSISDYAGPAVEWRIEYGDPGVQEEIIQKEGLTQAWTMVGPRSIFDPQLKYKSDKVIITCSVNKCLIKKV